MKFQESECVFGCLANTWCYSQTDCCQSGNGVKNSNLDKTFVVTDIILTELFQTFFMAECKDIKHLQGIVQSHFKRNTTNTSLLNVNCMCL